MVGAGVVGGCVGGAVVGNRSFTQPQNWKPGSSVGSALSGFGFSPGGLQRSSLSKKESVVGGWAVFSGSGSAVNFGVGLWDSGCGLGVTFTLGFGMATGTTTAGTTALSFSGAVVATSVVAGGVEFVGGTLVGCSITSVKKEGETKREREREREIEIFIYNIIVHQLASKCSKRFNFKNLFAP